MKGREQELTAASVSRRSLVEWLGGAAVLGLWSPLLSACGTSANGAPHERGPGGILPGPAPSGASGTPPPSDAAADAASVPDAPRDVAQDPDVAQPADTAGASDASCGPDASPFAPGQVTDPNLVAWPEQTVDPQKLADILASWRLRVDGLVAKPRTYGFCELRDLGLVRQVTDLHCVGGWSVHDIPWDGLPLSTLLSLVEPLPSATHLLFHIVTGTYVESLPLGVAREPRSVLGLGVDGATLALEHGFPCRLVVPRLYGYKNAKYIERIELTDHAEPGFWTKAGFPYDGEVDPSRLRPGKY
jgi:DMSO/TMAO reductase YedYZ molybdopterin-dependent catalytic subunit